MQQNEPARERIKQTFLEMLWQPDALPEKKTQLLLGRIHTALSDHFRRYCSGYDPSGFDPAILLEGIIPGMSALMLDYNSISVSALTAAAGVNRTTFYKFYPNVSALYDDCCRDLTAQFLAVPIPKEKTPETMFRYGSALFQLNVDNLMRILALSHRVNQRRMMYVIARALKDKLASTLNEQEMVSFRVQENLNLLPELFSVFNGSITIDLLAPKLFPDRNLPAYDPKRTLIENIADHFAVRYGGDADYYYTLGGAMLKLLSATGFREIGVSMLCKTAGYPRGIFYQYFSDYTDYVMKVCENAVLVCYSAFLYFLENPDALTPVNLTVFRGEMIAFKIEGIRAIFLNGGISYIFAILFSYLTRRFLHDLSPDGAAPPDSRLVSLVSYYVTYAMRLFSMYYLGDMDDAGLRVRRKELTHIKKMLGFPEKHPG